MPMGRWCIAPKESVEDIHLGFDQGYYGDLSSRRRNIFEFRLRSWFVLGGHEGALYTERGCCSGGPF